MRLRDYQSKAIAAVHDEFKSKDSTLIVLPTGTGKTVVFSSIIDDMNSTRALVIAHREELIFQAADKIKQVTGEEPGIEMAEYRAHKSTMFGQHRVVVSSVQTQNAGNSGDGRMKLFNPMEFGLLVIDEAHHATAASYRRIIQHYRQNPKLKVLGVTATPDRADEEALGQVFESVAFDYEIVDAINDGWLVQIAVRTVVVDGLDLSAVRTTAGDLNGADLARVMEYESSLHEIAHPTMELTKGRKTLVFAASVAHAERLTEIFNRHETGCARFVCGETPRDERRRMFSDYTANRFRILVNVGVATEGFDEPSIEVIVMARPTKSRSLYAQMVGRGTRPLPGTVDRAVVEDAALFMPEWGVAQRVAAIAASGKPTLEIIDFVMICGKHKLVSAADILGGNHSEEIIAAAKAKVEKSSAPKNMMQALDEAAREAAAERKRQEEEEAARRASLRVKAQYSTQTGNPFDVLNITPARERGWDTGKQLTEKQIGMLEKQGIKIDGLEYGQAKQLIGEIFWRWDNNLCSYKQAKILKAHGHPTDVDRKTASEWIDQIFKKSPRTAPAPVDASAYSDITRY